MKTELNLTLPQFILDTAKSHNIKLCVPETNKSFLERRDNAIPDVIGVYIGMISPNTDQLISRIKDDNDNQILQKYIDLGLVITKNFCVSTDNDELKDVPYYFIPYHVKESSKYTETYTEDGPGYGHPINGHYICQYEILLGTENYTRQMIFKTDSVNINLTDWLNNLLEEIEDASWCPKEEMPNNNLYVNNDRNICFTVFNEIGSPQEVVCESMSEFKSMIRGIRQISCDFVYD